MVSFEEKKKYLDANFNKFIKNLYELVKIPNEGKKKCYLK